MALHNKLRKNYYSIKPVHAVSICNKSILMIKHRIIILKELISNKQYCIQDLNNIPDNAEPRERYVALLQIGLYAETI